VKKYEEIAYLRISCVPAKAPTTPYIRGSGLVFAL
jgi:hypothetical protein